VRRWRQYKGLNLGREDIKTSSTDLEYRGWQGYYLYKTRLDFTWVVI